MKTKITSEELESLLRLFFVEGRQSVIINIEKDMEKAFQEVLKKYKLKK